VACACALSRSRLFDDPVEIGFGTREDRQDEKFRKLVGMQLAQTGLDRGYATRSALMTSWCSSARSIVPFQR
jgi:hypothetical protein